jgi:4-hydroxybenzoate polyprenyltransferase
MSEQPSIARRGKAILRLFRLPALLTAPGDPLAGALLALGATGGRLDDLPLGSALGASLCLYAAGLLANDFFDRHADARERPDRPIPAGLASPFAVLLAALLLTTSGLFLAHDSGASTQWIAILLAATAWFYDALGKHVPFLGPLTMGLCRGLNLLLGASLFGVPGLLTMPVAVSAVFLTLVVTLITCAARHEAPPATGAAPPVIRLPRGLAAALPAILTLWLATLLAVRWDHLTPSLHAGASGLSIGLAALSVIWTALSSVKWYGPLTPAGLQRGIGGVIRGFILTQAAVCATCGPVGESFALLVLMAFPVAGWIGKWFYAT